VNDDRIIKLLEEIRDLQRQHVENYKSAIRNQEESVRLQKSYSRRTVPILVFFVVLILLISYGPLLWRWLFRP
jgi:hypothetical protein